MIAERSAGPNWKYAILRFLYFTSNNMILFVDYDNLKMCTIKRCVLWTLTTKKTEQNIIANTSPK